MKFSDYCSLNWLALNEVLKGASYKDCVSMLKHECKFRNRPAHKDRIKKRAIKTLQKDFRDRVLKDLSKY